MLTVKDARAQYNILSVLNLDNGKHKIVCPLPMHSHHDYTPSFSIFFVAGTQFFKCHGSCGVEGDVVDLIGYLRIAGYNRRDPAQVIRALQLLEDRWEPCVVVPERRVELKGGEWRDFLPADDRVMEYAMRRGLSYETIVRYNLGGWDNFMTMPNFEEGMLVGIKLRRIVPGEPRFFSLKGSRLGLFNYGAVNLSTKTVFIVKGEIPCMLLDQMGIPACAPTGGEASWNKHTRWKTALALANRVVIGDNDGPGRVMGPKRAELLGASLVYPPDGFKDVDEFILARPEEAMTQLMKWSEYDCQVAA